MLNYNIILPFYNDYKYLKRCLNNINAQTLLSLNLIFIDGGNKDNNYKKLVLENLNKKINLIYLLKKYIFFLRITIR